jgi:predicted RNase H-like nuclease (RuvC/YqgF family)
MAKENKKSNLNPKKEKKTIAEKVQLRLSQLDKKSANISKQIASLQQKLDESNKLKSKIETLKGDLAKVKRAKELELAEISLMCSTYAKPIQTQAQSQESPIVEASMQS